MVEDTEKANTTHKCGWHRIHGRKSQRRYAFFRAFFPLHVSCTYWLLSYQNYWSILLLNACCLYYLKYFNLCIRVFISVSWILVLITCSWLFWDVQLCRNISVSTSLSLLVILTSSVLGKTWPLTPSTVCHVSCLCIPSHSWREFGHWKYHETVSWMFWIPMDMNLCVLSTSSQCHKSQMPLDTPWFVSVIHSGLALKN